MTAWVKPVKDSMCWKLSGDDEMIWNEPFSLVAVLGADLIPLHRPHVCWAAPPTFRRDLAGSRPISGSVTWRVLQVNNSHKAEAPHRPGTEHTNGRVIQCLKNQRIKESGLLKGHNANSDSGVKRPWMRCGDSKTKLLCHSRSAADVTAHKRGDAEAVKYSTPWSQVRFFLCLRLVLQSNMQPSSCQVFCLRAQRGAFTLRLSGNPHFDPFWVKIKYGLCLCLLMGGLVWPEDTGLQALVVVSMGMSRTWGGIWLTGNVVYCWLSGMGRGQLLWLEQGGGLVEMVVWTFTWSSNSPQTIRWDRHDADGECTWQILRSWTYWATFSQTFKLFSIFY